MATVTHRYESAQYDGTNSAAILAFLDGASYTLVEANEARLVLTDSEGSRKTIPTDGWVIRLGWSHELVWQGTNTAYLAQWTVVS